MIFAIRFITAACLFILLGKANIWLNPLSNIILAMGYRFFLILSPLFYKVFKGYAVSIALILAAVGLCLYCFHIDSLVILGSILVGVGLSISGYLIKVKASETATGAAHNKIALNLGSFVSGLILLFTINSKEVFFSVCALVLVFTSIGACITNKKEICCKKSVSLVTPTAFNKKHFFAWLLIGVAIGIKLFGVFSVLPQYLIERTGFLPNWYGMMILLNSMIVVLFQLPIIHWIDRRADSIKSFKIVIFVMIIGMLIISCPSLFYAENVIGAVFWIILLSLVECFASYLDVLGAKAQFLLIKETAIGFGAGLTVFLSREFSSPLSGISISLIGACTILIAVFLLKKERQVSSTYDILSNKNLRAGST